MHFENAALCGDTFIVGAVHLSYCKPRQEMLTEHIALSKEVMREFLACAAQPRCEFPVGFVASGGSWAESPNERKSISLLEGTLLLCYV